MCGRLNVIDDPLSVIVCEKLGIKFKTNTNNDLRPTQDVSAVGIQKGGAGSDGSLLGNKTFMG